MMLQNADFLQWGVCWMRPLAAVLFCILAGTRMGAAIAAEQAEKPAKILPIPGEVSSVEGCTAFLIVPETKGDAATAMPWVWYAPTLPGLPGAEETWMFKQYLEAGIAIAGIDVGESFGSSKGRALYTAFYEELTQQRGLSAKPCLLARSRGGLMLYNWAVEHPMSVSCIAGIYPVCNLTSYPGFKKACSAYEMGEEELTASLEKHNPVSRVAPLAKAGVPIFHIHGDSDAIVPIEKNSAALAEQYQKHGGKMKVKVIEGQGHTMWTGWFQCQELVDFVITHAKERDPNKQDAGDEK